MWRGASTRFAPPEPWPSRVLAFEVACALQAGRAEGAVTGLFELMKAVHTKKKG